MCQGMRDVVNLWWKLAAVIRDVLPRLEIGPETTSSTGGCHQFVGHLA